MNSKLSRLLVILSFISVPLISSVISMVHLVDLFMLGNPGWMSKTISFAIELGAIASFLALSVMGKLNKFFVWSIFIILFIMQIIGNVYFSFNYLTEELMKNPNHVNSFKEMLGFFMDGITIIDIKMYISLLIGTVIPLISIFLLKSLTEYIGNDQTEEDSKIENEETEYVVKEEISEINTPEIIADNVEEILDEVKEETEVSEAQNIEETNKEVEVDMIKPLSTNLQDSDMIVPSTQKIDNDTIQPVKNLHPAHVK